jgi:P27 family predicted phage terminase small subunit
MKTSTPEHLSKPARELWDRIRNTYAITDEAGILLLTTAMESWDRAKQAQDIIRKDGPSVVDRWGQTKAHPMIAVERNAHAALLAALRALDLDVSPKKSMGGQPRIMDLSRFARIGQ